MARWDFTGDLPTFYADFGEPVVVAGNPLTAIFDGGYVDALGIASTQPSLRCMAADVAAAQKGAAVVRAGVNYTVETRQPVAPDELEVRLMLRRV